MGRLAAALAVTCVLAAGPARAADVQAIVTKGSSDLKGKTVILHDDGTWELASTGSRTRLMEQLGRAGGWGAAGTAAGQFQGPVGIGVDQRGNVYVADKLNHRVQVFTAGGRPKAQWPVEFHPTAVAVGPKGRVYVTTDASLGEPAVQVYDAKGKLVASWGTQGKSPGQFDGAPQGIAVDRQGRVYVADTFSHRIQVFAADGTRTGGWGSLGTGAGQFNQPGAVAVGDDGHVYVADIMNNRVEKFTAAGKFVTAWGSKGTDPGQFWAGVRSLWVDEPGTVWTLSAGGGIVQLQRFDTAGKLLMGWRESDPVIDLSSNEVGLCIRGADVYIADTGNNRIVKLRLSQKRERGGAF